MNIACPTSNVEPKTRQMKRFDRDRLLFALILALLIMGVVVYRRFIFF